MQSDHRICDYEGSDYQADFWAGRGRDYEDMAERIALRRLMPPPSGRLLEIGAGYGRLSEFYAGYDEVVLLDYSRSLLRQARGRMEQDKRIQYVAASFYELPFAADAFDTVLMVRVMHHAEDVPALFGQVARVLRGGGHYVLEFANKRHLKAIVRYVLLRQRWSPFDRAPVEFAEMNLDFHPTWMEDRLSEAGFHVKHRRTVSHFRLPLLKRLVPPRALAALDGLCQPTGRWWQYTPSVFFQCTMGKPMPGPRSGRLLQCPICGQGPMDRSPTGVTCSACGRRWAVEDDILCFKEKPISAPGTRSE
jgi:ubiquinone/menaquinone biosynthesis C-methylase UbiE